MYPSIYIPATLYFILVMPKLKPVSLSTQSDSLFCSYERFVIYVPIYFVKYSQKYIAHSHRLTVCIVTRRAVTTKKSIDRGKRHFVFFGTFDRIQ